MHPQADAPTLASRRPSPANGPAQRLDAALREFASWFVVTPHATPLAHERVRRLELLALFGILVLAAVVRFWGLGAVGLHGDEKTMALPMLGVIEKGESVFPSGMYYVRAISQVYLMAWSTEIFGMSEWAMRLPSVLCGLLLIALCFFVGRRFLTTPWNLAFTAVVAFLPEFIIAAQTARMYVFFVTSVAAFLLLLFKWEKTGSVGYLAGTLVAYAIGLQFHTLMIFSAPLLLYPGLVKGDRRMILQGGAAFAVAALGFLAMDAWISSKYPDVVPLDGAEPLRNAAKAASALPEFSIALLAGAVLAAAAIAIFLVRPIATRRMAIVGGVLIAFGSFAQFLFHYHLAAMLIVAGLVVLRRSGPLPRGRLIVFCVWAVLLAVAQVLLLKANGAGSLRLAAGAMMGRPSIWPLIVATHYSLAASVLVAITGAIALWKLAHRQPVPDFALFVALGVWVPLLIVGTQKWWILPRYADGQALPLLLSAVAMAQWLFTRVNANGIALRSVRFQAVAAAVLCVLVVDPVTVARTVNAGYAMNPDHKGAAEFMKTLPLAANDIVIAEDALQQVYYFGRVDYWLNGKDIAQQFVHEVDGKVREFYTNAPLIGSGEELQALIDKPDRGTIYVIGSGENQEDGRKAMRAYGIAEVMDSGQFEPIFLGRDGLTRVWKVAPK